MCVRNLRLLLLSACLLGSACTPATDDNGGTPKGGSTGSGGRAGNGGATGSGGSGYGTGGSLGSGGSASGSGGSSYGTGGSLGSGGSGTGGSASGSGGSGSGGTVGADSGGGETPASGEFPPGPHKVVLLVGDTNTNDPSRLEMIDILKGMKASHNVDLEIMNANAAKSAALMDRALIIAGPNSTYCSESPDAGMKTLPVPIMVSKDCRTTEFGFGQFANTAEYTTGLPLKINIINPTHPLAAGLTGTVPVLTTRNRFVRGRALGPGAIKIATTPEEPNASWGIFAYEKDGEMPGGLKAPAKRVGFFWHRPSGVTPEGKKLFIAAVEWAIRP